MARAIPGSCYMIKQMALLIMKNFMIKLLVHVKRFHLVAPHNPCQVPQTGKLCIELSGQYIRPKFRAVHVLGLECGMEARILIQPPIQSISWP